MSTTSRPNPKPPHKTPKSEVTTPLKSTTKLRLGLAVVGLLITLVVTNLTIRKYENHLATAEEVLLELAPADPRSLMQGDYMALNYAIAEPIVAAIEAQEIAQGNLEYAETWYTISREGLVVIKKNAQGVGHFVRLVQRAANANQPLAPDELLLQYRIRQGQLKIATNAFFFQEGQAEAFQQAKYGLFRLNQQGQPLLTHMVDAEFRIIDPDQKKTSQKSTEAQ